MIGYEMLLQGYAEVPEAVLAGSGLAVSSMLGAKAWSLRGKRGEINRSLSDSELEYVLEKLESSGRDGADSIAKNPSHSYNQMIGTLNEPEHMIRLEEREDVYVGLLESTETNFDSRKKQRINMPITMDEVPEIGDEVSYLSEFRSDLNV